MPRSLRLCVSAFIFIFVSSTFADSANDLTLWYAQAGRTWMTEALPIGNGRIGGMVFGGIEQEHIQFNEDTLWSGGPQEPPAGGAEHLGQIQNLLASGDTDSVTRMMKQYFASSAKGAYQPFGDLYIDVHPAGAFLSDYRRELDLAVGVARVKYSVDSQTVQREYFCSYPDQVMVMHFTSAAPHGVSLTIRMTTSQSGATVAAEGNRITMDGNLRGNGLGYQAILLAEPSGGTISASRQQLEITQADSVTLLLTAATEYKAVYPNYRGNDYRAANASVLANVAGKSYADLLAAHEKDYASLFGRVSLNLGPGPSPDEPTDQRLAAYHDGTNDPALAALFFQFGRYLLISSSRDSLPSNRQGLWNDSASPGWGADFPTMMNLEMMYLPAETANLPECATPLISMIGGLVQPGTVTAQKCFGADGWVVNYTTTPWGFTAAGAGIYNYFPAGAAWLCQHLWEHYAFSQDQDYLRNTAYPIMKSAAEFWAERLVAQPDGTLMSSPSESPEHGGFVIGAMMDQEIVHDLFAHCIEASQILGVDADFRAKLADMKNHLAPLKIGKRGQLQEWQADIDDPTDTHRHVSHLWALYPGDQISPLTTPDLANAARQTLAERGDGGPAFGLAWKIGYWARLLDGDHAERILRALMAPTVQVNPRSPLAGTYDNFFTARPPLQVDGNLAATAAIAEMLLQSQNGEIDLLPALPKAWPAGSVTGLRARGGFEVDESWSGGQLIGATIRSTVGGVCRVRRPGEQKVTEIDTTAAGSYQVGGQ
jgi:Glycosyl hydrolase family 65, N-terminal domain